MPPKFSIPIVSNFSSVLQSSQEKLKTMVMKNFLGKQVTLYSIWKCRTVIFSVVEVQLASVQLPLPSEKWDWLKSNKLSYLDTCRTVILAQSTLYKMNISLRWQHSASPKGVYIGGSSGLSLGGRGWGFP